ncbi:hypothetical protein H6P81_019096 [Aristolochia fimbriata]|uniref:Uncharacterized protein n=1 Tax=Aristolochia fimbriata TaxID=158543 RepID=A0AAV7DTE9_ARIFI|nr:hypothetical protein H6P81_019096 [Aristolochia fimbriata]
MGGFFGRYLLPVRPKTYEIFWVVKFNVDAFRWNNVPIKFKVAAAASGGGRYKQWSEKLDAYRRRSGGQWHEIKGGEFTVSPGGKGLFHFGMFETESDWWKGGHGPFTRQSEAQNLAS